MKAKLWQEMKSLSEVELDAKMRASKEQLFRIKFRHTSTPLKNPLEIRKVRRIIARIETLLHKKELEAKQQTK